MTVTQDAAAPDVVCFKRKLEDLQFREREFTLEQKQKLAAVELDKKQKLAAVELQECQIEVDKKKKLAEIEVQQKHEYSGRTRPQWEELRICPIPPRKRRPQRQGLQ